MFSGGGLFRRAFNVTILPSLRRIGDALILMPNWNQRVNALVPNIPRLLRAWYYA